MKKTRTLFALLCCLLLLLGTVHAENPFAGVEKAPLVPPSGFKGRVKLADMEKAGLQLPEDADKVTIDESGRYTIRTSKVTCGVSLPFGWIGITQDLMAQLDLYLTLTDDPIKALNSLIEDKISLLSYAPDMENLIAMRVYADGMSMLLGNMSVQDENTMASVLNYYKGQVDSAAETSVERVGNHTFVRMAFVQDSTHMVLYETVYNNTNICLTLQRDSAEDESLLEDFMAVLEELTLAITPEIANERG